MDIKRALRVAGDITLLGTLFLSTFFVISTFFGVPYPLKVVLSGSMKPTFDRGDLVIVLPSKDIQIGDIVAVRTCGGLEVLHRVVKVEGNGIVTRGDANNLTDQKMCGIKYTPLSYVEGKAVSFLGHPLRIPRVGYLAIYMGPVIRSIMMDPVKLSITSSVLMGILIAPSIMRKRKDQSKRKDYIPRLFMIIALGALSMTIVGILNSRIASYTVIVDPKLKTSISFGSAMAISPNTTANITITIRNVGILPTMTIATMKGELWSYTSPRSGHIISKIDPKGETHLKFSITPMYEGKGIERLRGKVHVWNIFLGFILPRPILELIASLDPIAGIAIGNTLILLIITSPFIVFLVLYKERKDTLILMMEQLPGRLPKILREFSDDELEELSRIINDLERITGRRLTKSVKSRSLVIPVVIAAMFFIMASSNYVWASEYVSYPSEGKVSIAIPPQANIATENRYWSSLSNDMIKINLSIVGSGEISIRNGVVRIYNYDDEPQYVWAEPSSDLTDVIYWIKIGGKKVWKRGSGKIGEIKINSGNYKDVTFKIDARFASVGQRDGRLIIHFSDHQSESGVASWKLVADVQRPSKRVVINEVELNPPGSDSGNEWIELYNPSYRIILLRGWKVKALHGEPTEKSIPPHATLLPHDYYVFNPSDRWLDNRNECIQLIDNRGKLVDFTILMSDTRNNKKTWQRAPDGSDNWKFKEGTKGSSN